ncbi:hypothetical protein PMAYCL1PPCAC_29056, partial [Pristionchus mayeri]
MRAFSPSSQCSSSCVCAEIDGSAGCGFGCGNQQVQQCSFVGGLRDSQYCLLDHGIGSCSIHPQPCSSPCAHASAQSLFACGYGCSSYLTEETVTANASAEVSPQPVHPVSSSSPFYDSSSPLSFHSFNIPLSDSPDSNADYNQHYSPYDKPFYEKEFADLELDHDIIDEFLIPDRQSFFQLDASPLQIDSQPVSPQFFNFIDDIIGEVREEILIEKASPSPSDTLAESISLIAHSDIDAKLKIVTSSNCSEKAYKVTIEPVKKSRKRLAPPPPPACSGVKKERIDISKLSREEAAERKRYQNRVAAQRYRAKIREERDSEFSECVFLEDRNSVLREQEEMLSAEIAKFKELLLNRAA